MILKKSIIQHKLKTAKPTTNKWRDCTEWKLNGVCHRKDGPAIEYYNGVKRWFVFGKRHRIDGPACEVTDGKNSFHVNGEYIFVKEYKQVLTFINFIRAKYAA